MNFGVAAGDLGGPAGLVELFVVDMAQEDHVVEVGDDLPASSGHTPIIGQGSDNFSVRTTPYQISSEIFLGDREPAHQLTVVMSSKRPAPVLAIFRRDHSKQ